jgi:hypothetical protein
VLGRNLQKEDARKGCHGMQIVWNSDQRVLQITIRKKQFNDGSRGRDSCQSALVEMPRDGRVLQSSKDVRVQMQFREVMV